MSITIETVNDGFGSFYVITFCRIGYRTIQAYASTLAEAENLAKIKN